MADPPKLRRADRSSLLSWTDDQRFAIGDTTFRALPPGAIRAGTRELGDGMAMRGADFLVVKSRSMLERYAELLARLQPRNILELGVYQGGSTAFLVEVAHPRRLVALDRTSLRSPVLRRYLSRRGLDDVVRLYGRVDQADRPRLAQIVDEAFAGDPLDLVIDDCSHQYEPTRASFNELFPRLRPDGLYVIEDWSWAHTGGAEPLEGAVPDQAPPTRLAFELVLAVASMAGLIVDLVIEPNFVVVRRGDATVDSTFDISACSNPRGRDLLAPI